MAIINNTQALIDLIKELGCDDLYRQALDLQSEIIQLFEENKIFKEKVDTKEGCYWDKNSENKGFSPEGCPVLEPLLFFCKISKNILLNTLDSTFFSGVMFYN